MRQPLQIETDNLTIHDRGIQAGHEDKGQQSYCCADRDWNFPRRCTEHANAKQTAYERQRQYRNQQMRLKCYPNTPFLLKIAAESLRTLFWF